MKTLLYKALCATLLTSTIAMQAQSNPGIEAMLIRRSAVGAAEAIAGAPAGAAAPAIAAATAGAGAIAGAAATAGAAITEVTTTIRGALEWGWWLTQNGWWLTRYASGKGLKLAALGTVYYYATPSFIQDPINESIGNAYTSFTKACDLSEVLPSVAGAKKYIKDNLSSMPDIGKTIGNGIKTSAEKIVETIPKTTKASLALGALYAAFKWI